MTTLWWHPNPKFETANKVMGPARYLYVYFLRDKHKIYYTREFGKTIFDNKGTEHYFELSSRPVEVAQFLNKFGQFRNKICI